MIEGRTYTASVPASSACGYKCKWTFVYTIGGKVDKKDLDGGTTVSLPQGDPFTSMNVSCISTIITSSTCGPGLPQTYSGTRIIVPKCNGAIVAPGKITIGVPFPISALGKNNYSTGFTITAQNGSKWTENTMGDEKKMMTISGCPPGILQVQAIANGDGGNYPPDKDVQTATIELLAAPSITDVKIQSPYRDFYITNRPDTYFVSKGSRVQIKTFFVNGTGTIAGTQTTSGQIYETAAISDESSLELVVDNGFGGTAKRSITLIPIDTDLSVRFITINQGVERYLKAEDQENGTFNNSSFPQDFWQAQKSSGKSWKSQVPLIAGRPARFTVHMVGQGAIPFGTADSAKNKLTLVLSNPGSDPVEIKMNTPTFTAPTTGTSFGETKASLVAQFDVIDPALLTDETSLQVKVVLDPALGIDPIKGIDNSYRDPVRLGLSYTSPVNIELRSIAYLPYGATQPIETTYQERIDLASRTMESIKTAMPVSYINANGDPNISITPTTAQYPASYTWVETNSNGVRISQEQMLNNLDAQWLMTGFGNAKVPNTYILGVLKNSSSTQNKIKGDYGGIARMGRHIAIVYAVDPVNAPNTLDWEQTNIVHEIGHMLGSAHAPYMLGAHLSGFQVDDKWFKFMNDAVPPYQISPYRNAAIGVPGFSGANPNWKTQGVNVPATQRDLMCYESDPLNLWVSDYNFYQWFSHTINPNGPTQILYQVNP